MLPQVLLVQVVSLGTRQSLSLQLTEQHTTGFVVHRQTIALFQICYNQVFHIKEIGLKFLLQLALAELHFLCRSNHTIYIFSEVIWNSCHDLFLYI